MAANDGTDPAPGAVAASRDAPNRRWCRCGACGRVTLHGKGEVRFEERVREVAWAPAFVVAFVLGCGCGTQLMLVPVAVAMSPLLIPWLFAVYAHHDSVFRCLECGRSKWWPRRQPAPPRVGRTEILRMYKRCTVPDEAALVGPLKEIADTLRFTGFTYRLDGTTAEGTRPIHDGNRYSIADELPLFLSAARVPMPDGPPAAADGATVRSGSETAPPQTHDLKCKATDHPVEVRFRATVAADAAVGGWQVEIRLVDDADAPIAADWHPRVENLLERLAGVLLPDRGWVRSVLEGDAESPPAETGWSTYVSKRIVPTEPVWPPTVWVRLRGHGRLINVRSEDPTADPRVEAVRAEVDGLLRQAAAAPSQGTAPASTP